MYLQAADDSYLVNAKYIPLGKGHTEVMNVNTIWCHVNTPMGQIW